MIAIIAAGSAIGPLGMETDSCYLSSHMQGEASPYLGLSMQPQMADVAWEAECLLVAGASGQSGPL